ncbi:sigma 54-interacting transcriptional regulator [Hartmannibacter diazotrophicus]|uniref:sigma 54-interacting transcriptional regulator n=1 Tax=Hartmannibacter diazotrophicus TaxID=1482074 RepID=UPI001FECDFA9|nr:sigma 54-interacting transcriptional regulator [Hartmannibacter diazotrophicus]
MNDAVAGDKERQPSSTADHDRRDTTLNPQHLGAILLRQFFERAPNATLLIAPESGLVIQANRAASALFRRKAQTIAGRSLAEFYPEQMGIWHVFTEEALVRGHAFTRDLTLALPDGRPHRLEHMAVATEQDGEDYLLVTITDLDVQAQRSVDDEANTYHRKGLDEWRRAERYFREIEREHHLILAAAGEGIYGVNVQGETTFVNPAAATMLGYDPAELIGKDMHSVIHHHKADGTPYAVADCPIYNAFKQGTVKTVDDEVFWGKDGRSVRVEYTSTPIVDNGAMVGAVIVFRDISERKLNEERLRTALADNARLRERLEMENAYLREEIRSQAHHHNILGTSDAVANLIRQIELVAPTDANVLVTGESGTGKELVAHAIHRASARSDRPLIRVNCAAIPRELFESEFFGHVRGAFTGALRDRVGRFELANGGTIFLDEVGEIPLDLQSKLLRVLQDRRFERIGEDRTREVDVRVIAATNRDLKQESAAGRFREDLYFRLNVFPIECLPLRERTGDIPVLAAEFLATTCARLNLPVPKLTKANVEMLRAYSWPGNARELQNVVERAAILARGGKLAFSLPETGRPGSATETATNAVDAAGDDAGSILTAAEMIALEEANIRRALEACRGKVSGPGGAAELLGMKATTLYSRLKAMAPPSEPPPGT